MVQTTAVRLGFSKTGNLRFISHLDLARTMGRIMIRAGVPIWYSEGFNPRPKMVFSLPLSIGTESICEFMDFKITSDMPCEEIARRISEEFTSEMKVNGVWYPEHSLKEIEYAEYEIIINSKHAGNELASGIEDLMSSPLVITKNSKGKEKEVDIYPLIKSKHAEYVDGAVKITAMLCCNSAEYLNPELLVKAISDRFGIDFTDVATEYYTVTRTKVKLADGETDFR